MSRASGDTYENHSRAHAQSIPGRTVVNKASLRRQLRERRRNISPVVARDAALRAADYLAANALWHDALHLGLYLPNDGELSTESVVQLARNDCPEKTLYLPRLREQTLEFAPWLEKQTLVANHFTIGEPQTPAVNLTSLDLIILPTVGWAHSGFRLGMGGGFYDRCLGGPNEGEKPWLLGLAYSWQCVDELLGDVWDVPVDGVITEEGVIGISTRLKSLKNT